MNKLFLNVHLLFVLLLFVCLCLCLLCGCKYILSVCARLKGLQAHPQVLIMKFYL